MIPIYTIADFSPYQEKEKHFVIVPFEKLNEPPGFSWPHKHNFYEILWIRNGTSKHIIDDHELDISTHGIYFMSPGQVHLFEKYESVKGDCIMFTEEFLTLNFINKEVHQRLSFFENSYKLPYINLEIDAEKLLEQILKLIYDEFLRFDESKAALSSILYFFLNSIGRLYDSQLISNKLSSHVLIFNKFKEFTEQHFSKHKPLSFYASELCVTVHHLNEVVKKITTKTASEVIRDRVMLEAKRMLAHSHTPIGQIAEELGFKDFSYFSRQFKKYHNLTPDQYRGKMYEKYQFR